MSESGLGRSLLLVGALAFLVPPPPAATAASPGGFVIVRDSYGVPHIYAETVSGLFRGEGYAVAQDRLWQLELYSRSGKGTLAEIFGWDYLSHDKRMRREGYTPAEIDSQYRALSPETQTVIEAYVEGVNGWIEEVRADPVGLLPYEFWEIGRLPSFWTREDVLAAVRFLTRTFGAAGGKELFMLEELERLGPYWFNVLYPINDPAAPTTILPGGSGDPGGSSARGARRGCPAQGAGDRLADYLELFGRRVSPAGLRRLRWEEEDQARVRRELGLPSTFGSYALALGSAKTATGYGMLLGAPQTGTVDTVEAQLGVEVDLQGAGFRVSGMAVAGIPGVVVGRNGDLAWSLTSGLSDNRDTYIETVAGSDFRHYRFQGEWIAFESRTDTIPGPYGNPVYYEVLRSVHGPVSEIDSLAGQAFTRKMAFWGNESRFVEMLLGLAQAVSLDHCDSAVARNPVSFNVLCATTLGDAGYWHAGRFPLRAEGVDPRFPQSGEGEEEWVGLVPFTSLPRCRNQPSGYFANWNNKPSADWDNGDNVPWVGWQHVEYIFEVVDAMQEVFFGELVSVPRRIWSRGTYEQVIDLHPTGVYGLNILPPGQSGFIDRNGVRDPHFTDQYETYMLWAYKQWSFDPGVPTDVGGGAAEKPVSPEICALGLSAEPCPAGGEVRLWFRLGERSPVRAAVYDAAGRRIRALGEGEVLIAGRHDILWDGRDERGELVPAGVYFVRVSTPDLVESAKLVLSR